MRKHAFIACLVFMNLVSALHGMENNSITQREIPPQEVKEGSACTALIPAPIPFLVGGFFMYAGGKLVPIGRKPRYFKDLKWIDQKATTRPAFAPLRRENIHPIRKIALPSPHQKQSQYRRPGECLLFDHPPKSEQQLRQEAYENRKYGLD